MIHQGLVSREGAIAREVRTSVIFQPPKTRILIDKVFNRKT